MNKLLVLAIVLLGLTGIYLQLEGASAETPERAVGELAHEPAASATPVVVSRPAPAAAQAPRASQQTKKAEQPRTSTPAPPLFPLEGGKVSRGKGWYKSDFYNDWRYHQGVDIRPGSGAGGTLVRACVEGTVEWVGTDEFFGTTVVVRASDGTQWKYSGLSSSQVSKGGRVSRGAVLGTINGAPAAEPEYPHLHLEVVGPRQEELDPALILGSG
ncbi:MAG: peptidoglycan DD-metalloendopeptidase family protein [Bacillota bacterium]